MTFKSRGTTETQLFTTPYPTIAGAFNFPGSQGMQYQQAAVQDCLAKGLTECPDMSLQASLNAAHTLDEIRRQIGLVYPADSRPDI